MEFVEATRGAFWSAFRSPESAPTASSCFSSSADKENETPRSLTRRVSRLFEIPPRHPCDELAMVDGMRACLARARAQCRDKEGNEDKKGTLHEHSSGRSGS